MGWSDALVGGGFALAGTGFGAAIQQLLAGRHDRTKYERDLADRERQEEHLACVDVVRSARRVQRALLDLASDWGSPRAAQVVATEVDRLAEVVASVRLIVNEAKVVAEAEAFEYRAKRLKDTGHWEPDERPRLSPLIEAIRRYESARKRSLRPT